MKKKMKSILRLFIIFCLLTLSSCIRLSGQIDQSTTQNPTTATVTETQITETIETPTNPAKEYIVLTQPQIRQEIDLVDDIYIDGDENYKDKTYLLSNGNAIALNGIISSLEYSMNRSSVAILFDADEDGRGRLVLYDETGEFLIGKKVSLYQVSDSGKSVAFLEEYSTAKETGTLVFYSNESGSNVVISENGGRYFAISSNGKHVAYTEKDASDDINSFHCYLFLSSGQRREIGKNVIPIAVSDDGALVYGVRVETDDSEDSGLSLWVFKDGTESETGRFSGTDGLSSIIFNSDCSQILFESDVGIHFSQDGKSPILITEEEENSLRVYSFRMHSRSTKISNYWVTAFFSGTEKLSFVPFSVGFSNYSNSMIYFDDNMSPNVIVKNIDDYILKDQTVYAYSHDRKSIISVSYSEENGWEINDIVSNLSRPRSMEISKDNSVFFVDDKGCLCKLPADEEGEPQLISDQCVNMVRVPRDGKPDLIYYCQPDTLMATDSGYISIHYHDLYVVEDTPDAVPQLVSNRVGLVNAGDYGVYYLVLESVSESILNNYPGYCTGDLYDLNNLYYAGDGENFKLIGPIKMLYYSPGG